jgi:hypothetical protein
MLPMKFLKFYEPKSGFADAWLCLALFVNAVWLGVCMLQHSLDRACDITIP